MSLARSSPQLEAEKGCGKEGGDERGEEDEAERKAKDGVAGGFRAMGGGGIRGRVCRR